MRDYPVLFADAVQYFWSIRSRGAVGRPAEFAGRRAEVVGGKHCDGFLLALSSLLVDAGLDETSIFLSQTQIPGFFRSAKAWDLLVVSERRLLAVVEIKSQVGPSFANNFNNRSEEAIGNATDLWTAYREGGYRNSPAPFLGYIFLLEECEKSMRPTRPPEPHFDVFPEFKAASYASRYEELCRRLVSERLYTAATLLLSSQAQASERPNYREVAADLSVERFCDQLLRHVVPM